MPTTYLKILNPHANTYLEKLNPRAKVGNSIIEKPFQHFENARLLGIGILVVLLSRHLIGSFQRIVSMRSVFVSFLRRLNVKTNDTKLNALGQVLQTISLRRFYREIFLVY